MPTDRLFKFSISGMMFLLSCIFFYFLFGGQLDYETKKFLADGNFTALILVFFSTPIIGTIISTIVLAIRLLYYDYEIFYYLPHDLGLVKSLLDDNPDLRERIIVNDKLKWNKNKNTKKEFYPIYQAKVKHFIEGEKLQFLERRWSTYITHINNRWAIGFALVAVILLKPSSKNVWTMDWDFSTPYKYIGLFFLVGYFFSSVTIGEISREQASKFEHILLKKAIDGEIKSNRRANRRRRF